MALDESPNVAAEKTERQRWMSLLASAKSARLDALLPRKRFPHFVYLRKPETGLVMLRGRRHRLFDARAIIGSLSIVTKDVPPYAIVAGTPAQFIKWRHPEAIGGLLQALAWWGWDHETLRRALKDFRSLPVEAFLERYDPESPKLARIAG
jgi:hypothetical protein